MTEEDLLTTPIRDLSPEQRAEANNLRIRLDDKTRKENAKYRTKFSGVASVISDDLGINGVFSHADGKFYSSKSAYYKSVRAAGMEIVGNEKLPINKPPVRDIDWHLAVKETLERKGY